MGTIKIGSSTNRKGITVNPNEVFFNGSNVKKIMSGLTEIWSNVKALVPNMTSNTVPYGEVSASSIHNTIYDAYKAFNNDDGYSWNSTASSSNQWLQYKFVNPAKLEHAIIGHIGDGTNHLTQIKYKIQVSTDGVNWKDVSAERTTIKDENVTIPFNNIERCMYCRVLQTSGNAGMSINSLQFYGTQLKALVPTMTSATTPSGEVVANGGSTTGYEPYKAFNNGSGIWADFSQGQGSHTTWIYYKFDSPKKVRSFYVRFTVTTIFKFQASNDGSNFTDLTQNLDVAQNTINYYDINNDKEYLYYRIYVMSQTYSSAFYPGQLDEVQMYEN